MDWFLGGNAGFEWHRWLSGSGESGKASLVDMNGDGRADLVRTDTAGEVVSVRFGRADGGFDSKLAAVTQGTAKTLGDLFKVDINGDGLADSVFRDGTNNLWTSLAKTGGGFEEIRSLGNILLGGEATSTKSDFQVSFGDVNGDGSADLVVERNSDKKVWVRWGLQSGGFSQTYAVANQALGTGAAGILADMDGDGRADWVRSTKNAAGSETARSVYFGKRNGSFETTASAAVVKDGVLSSGEGVGADVDRDGIKDMVYWTGTASNNKLRILRGLSGGGYADAKVLTLSGANAPANYKDWDVLWGDVNGDSQLDAGFVSKTGSRDILWYLGGNGSLVYTRTVAGTSENGAPKLTDVDGDGVLDLVRTSVDAGGVVTASSVYFGKGDGTFASTAIGSVMKNGQRTLGEVFTSDWNGDGVNDLLFRASNGTVRIALGGQPPAWTTLSGLAGAFTDKLILADVNGDDKADLVWVKTNGTVQTVQVQHSSGTGTATTFGTATTGLSDAGEASLVDVDGDGRMDLVRTVSDAAGIVSSRSVRFGQSTGGFASTALIAVMKNGARSFGEVFTADLNGDGVNDRVFRDANNNLRAALGARNAVTGDISYGAWTSINSARPSSGVSFATSLFVGDANGDGKAEVLWP
jgi:hypothetical protein